VARWASWTAVTISVLLLVVSVGGYLVLNHYNGQIGRVHIHLPGAAAAPDPDGSARNILLVGSDTRDFAGGSQFQAPKGSADYTTGQRSDTTILVHLPADASAPATMVSFPRDSYVQIPAYTDPATGKTTAAHYAKFNEAYAIGGPPLLVQLVQQLTGLRIDHYLQVNFAGFQGMVDALGGVTICVGTSRHDPNSGDHLTAGTHHVDGVTALAFARDRYGVRGGDIGRIKDQQYLLAQLLKKLLSAGTLLNPFKLTGFLNAVTKNISADEDFDIGQMRSFALRMRHFDPAHLTLETLPFTTENGTRTIHGREQSVVLIDQIKADALFASLKSDHQTGRTPPLPALPAPSRVTVSVYNGTSRTGLAAHTVEQLSSLGYQAHVAGNAANHVERTEIRYGPSDRTAAQRLATTVPNAELVKTRSPGVALILGADFNSVRVGGTAGDSSPHPSATDSSRVATAADVSCTP
jgi:LCP family protein required for cell wall assembly